MSGLRARAARFAYSLAMRVAAPLYALRVLRRGRHEPSYGQHLGERFGLYRTADAAASPEHAIWIHAVSLGETRAAAALVAALRAAEPGAPIVFTHGTATGRDAGAPLLQSGDAQAWLPWDMPGAVRRFLRRYRPRVGVLMETEIWPNLLAEAAHAGVPMLLANARLSARSRRRGARVDALLRPAFASLAAALAQAPADAERLREAGVADVEVLGNLKFDIVPAPAQLALGRRWKEGAGRSVVLAAITREGEEALLLAAWRAVPAPRPLLVVVPRHPQRFDAVAELIQVSGFALARRSAWGEMPSVGDASADVWLGDSMMEMPAYYALADVALLGGSFLPFGGQNLIEAAACACPVVMGPHTDNFADAAELALAAGAAERAASVPAGVDAALALLARPADRARRASASFAFAAAHQGAAARSATRILALWRAGAIAPAGDRSPGYR